MKTRRTFTLATTLCLAWASQGQDWNALPGGNVIGSTEYLGAAPGSTIPLRIETRVNQPIQLYTNSVQRMRLNHTQTYTIGGFIGQNASGNLGLSPNNTLWTSAPGPFSRLHLHDGLTGVLQAGYRPWMDNGITFTTNFDQMYIGHKVEPGEDQTAAVIQWSDNEFTPAGPDVLKFIFTSNYTGGSGISSMDGREIARMHPTGWLGIGDWQAVGLQPDERLDVLTRTIRLREFSHPTWWRNDTYDRVLVANPADGRVYWRDANTLGGDDCDWEITANLDVVTAYDPAAQPGCPNEASKVGIGTDDPVAKLHVIRTLTDNPSLERAGYFYVRSSAGLAIGMDGLSDNGDNVHNVGGRGIARNAARSWGLWGLADSDQTGNVGVRADAYSGNFNTGVSANALNGGNAVGVSANASLANLNNTGVLAVGLNGLESYGLSAQAQGASNANYGIRAMAVGSNAWAGWFDGDVQITGDLWNNSTLIFSDGNLKTGVEDLTGALDKILQLSPKRYFFDHTVQPQINLPDAPQIGLIAQEVGVVVPEAVGSTVYPAQFDTTGAQLSEAYPLMGIDYTKLVPLLIGAVQEQQAQLAEQAARLDQLEQALALCCTNPANGQQLQTPGDGSEGRMLPDAASERLLTIAPNPFTEQTTVSYTLERGGRAMLMVHGSDGKHLQVLEEGARSEGQYQYVWHTAHLAPGVYYVTLLLDGEPLVKRAVKVR